MDYTGTSVLHYDCSMHLQIKLSDMDDLYFTHFSLLYQYEGILRAI